MTRVFLVRHGETEWNRTKRAQGHADIAMNTDGHRQAAHAAASLAHLEVAAVYSSDLGRAVDTARPIAEAHGLEVEIEPDLREIDQGEWEGLTVEEIRERWPELWGPARHYSARPGGESPQQVRARATRALARIVEGHGDQAVVLVSHGGTIRWITAEALGYDDRRSARIRGLGNGGIVQLDVFVENDGLAYANLRRLDGNRPDLDDPND
ncbi:MAG TPA: histidine phosphatase family protein [Actinomycetota bacterium]|nr:histidine phosphatase family protein [Actinomycetota bacterium]